MPHLPSDWRAVKALLKQTTSALLDKTAALQIPAVLHNTGLLPGTGPAPAQHVPEQEPILSTAQQSQSTVGQGLLASCALVLVSFMLGWWWGARQQRLHQATLQAQAADRQTEELTNISLPLAGSAESEDSSSIDKVESANVLADVQQSPAKHSAAKEAPQLTGEQLEQSAADEEAAAREQAGQTHDQPHVHIPALEQQAQTAQAPFSPAKQLTEEEASQGRCAIVDGQFGLASNAPHATSADEVSSRTHNAKSDNSSAVSLPMASAAHLQDDPIGAAAGVLVQKSCQVAAVQFMQLEDHRRAALAQQAYGIALNDYRQEQHHRSKLQENAQRAQHNALVSSGLDETRMWRKGKVHTQQLLEEHRQLTAFQGTLSDCLMCGLTVMLVALVYCGFTLGFLQGRLSACDSNQRRSMWQVWSLVKTAQSVLCYGNAVGDLLISALVMLGLPWFVAKQSLLTEGLKRPMTGMILGLGVVCGIVGCFVVSRLGANYLAWLVPYEVWIAVHVIVVSKARVLYRLLNTQHAHAQLWQQSEFRMPLYLAGMGFAAPVAIAAGPFWRFMF